MSETPKPSQLLASINLPPQDLDILSFCASNKAVNVKSWAESLKATKVMQTSSVLYKALPEVPRLISDFQNRFEILEILRPRVHHAITGLQKTFLNQPLIMPDDAQKAVVVAQSLQKNMIDGYIACLLQLTQKAKANQATFDLLAMIIHRAISGISLLFFRNYQIYSSPPANFWSTLNALFLVARYYKLTEKLVKDPILKSAQAVSINAIYARILMMATAKTNQMSQTEITLAYDIFESWCQSVKLVNGISDNIENFFVVNLLNAQGPVYKSKVSAPDQGVYVELDFQALLSQLSKQSSSSYSSANSANTSSNSSSSNSSNTNQASEIGANKSPAKVPKDFPDSLLSHLLETWSNVAQRKFDRRATETPAQVCVGLSSCHYFACNGQEFDYFLRSAGNSDTRSISRFSQGLTPAAHLNDEQNGKVPVYKVSLQNTSSGGYCMLWRDEISSRVTAGEIIGVKELGKRTWSIGVIRWVRQLKNASQLGIQLLSNNAKPWALAQMYQMGGYSDYMRALFLPPSKIGNGLATLITASAPFQEFDKVRIIDGEREWSATLERQLFVSKSVQQFQISNQDNATLASSEQQPLPKTSHGTSQDSDDFDSNWD